MKRILISLVLALQGLIVCASLPEVILRNTEGKEVNVAALAQNGKPLIISFFATYCKPCIREIKAIHELYPDWEEETGVQMILVSIDEGQDVQRVKPLVDGNGWDYPVLLDPNGTLKRAMNVQNVPHLFVLNSKGEIVYNHLSYTDGDEEEIYTYLK